MSPALRFGDCRYALSVHDPRKLPPPSAPEIAFVGRSNAGKSSALNALTSQRRLAFVSKTPGRTQLINFFAIGEAAFLVDLPGYGFAGVPRAVREHWGALVGDYVRDRPSLAGIMLAMDIRHPLTPADRDFLAWLKPTQKRVHVLLTKADKLSTQGAHRALAQARKGLDEAYPGATAQLFSALRKTGIDEARGQLNAWAETP